MRAFLLSALTGCCLVMCGCQANKSSQAAAEKPVNTTCPLSGEATDGTVAANFEGKTVAFCCGGCKDEFAKLSPEQRAAKLPKN